jgi:glycosyltransferase involved in cell wall biosynthesis
MLSVILPNFNHGRLIDRALTALLEQRLLPDEIIVIDDASTDDSLAIIKRLAAGSPRIRVVLNVENIGVVRTQNIGLEMSRERYVYFAAADDWVMPGFFELAISMLEAHPHSGLFCGETILVDGASSRDKGTRPIARPKYRAGYIDAESTRHLLMRTDNWILTGSAVLRRNAILAAGGLDVELGSFADGYLARKVALTHGFIFSPTVVSTWRIFESGISRVTALELRRAQKVLQIAPDRIRSDPVFPHWYAELFQKRWRFSVCRLALEAKPIDRSLLLSIGAMSSLDRTAFKVIWATSNPRLGRIATLAWLWFRLRPTSIFAVLRTAISRRLERLVCWGLAAPRVHAL